MPTPSWQAAVADGDQVRSSDAINQLLGAHGIAPRYEGTPLVEIGGNYGLWDRMLNDLTGAQIWYEQAFVMPAAQTTIGRIEMPLITRSGAGADVTVELHADSGGDPGTLLASITIPRALLNLGVDAAGQVVVRQTAPAQIAPGNFFAWTNNYLPANLPSGSQAKWQYAAATSLTHVVVAGGVNQSGTSTPTPQVYSAAFLGDELGPWMRGPDLPVSSGVAQLGLAVEQGYLIAAGGTTDGSAPLTGVYAARLDGTGEIGAWQDQPNLSTGVRGCGIASDGQGHVFVAGGWTGVSTVTAGVWMSTVSNGQLSAWQQLTPLPIGVAFHAMGFVNGWLVVAGGNNGSGQIGNCWIARVNTDGTIGAWRALPSISNAGLVAGGALGDSFLVYGAVGVDMRMLTITPEGDFSPQWVRQPFTQPQWTQFISWPATTPGRRNVVVLGALATNGAKTQIGTWPLVSVPLAASGLTAGATYHLVVKSSNADATHVPGVQVVSGAFLADGSSPAGPGRFSTDSGATWASLGSGTAIPIRIYNQDVAGQLIHLPEDGTARWTCLVASHYDDRLLQVAEVTGTQATVATLGYDLDGTLTSSTVE
jgi:hypothetical protein